MELHVWLQMPCWIQRAFSVPWESPSSPFPGSLGRPRQICTQLHQECEGTASVVTDSPSTRTTLRNALPGEYCILRPGEQLRHLGSSIFITAFLRSGIGSNQMGYSPILYLPVRWIHILHFLTANSWWLYLLPLLPFQAPATPPHPTPR